MSAISSADRPKNPKRVLAGRKNRALRGPLTPAGRERLGASARAHRPWDHATGPRSAAGKARSAANGTHAQKHAVSTRQVERDLAAIRAVVDQARALRLRIAAGAKSGPSGPVG